MSDEKTDKVLGTGASGDPKNPTGAPVVSPPPAKTEKTAPKDEK